MCDYKPYRPLLLLSIILGFLLLAAPAYAIQDKNIAVSKVTPATAVLVVKTDTSSDVTISYGSAPGSYSFSKTGSNQLRHEVLLDNLVPSSVTYYQVTITATANPADSLVLPEQSFKTTKTAGLPFSYGVVGDNRPPWVTPADQPAVWSTIVGQMAGEGLDLVLHSGDIINGNPTETPAQVEQRYDAFFLISSALTDSVPLYTTAGNHEWVQFPVTREGYEREFTLPVNNGADAATNGEEYYSFDQGDTHFINLCTELYGDEGYVRGNQLIWLQQDLAQNSKKWTVVTLHRPLYSKAHVTDPWVDPANLAGQQNRAELHAMFKQYGVDVVFAGHDHYYLRHIEDGIQYVVTGGAGSTLYNLPLFGPGDIFGASTYHHVRVDETATSMRLTTIDSTGTVLESFTLGSPNLTLSMTKAYWSSLDAYHAGVLSVDYSLGNIGPGDAQALSIAYLQSTNDVTPITGTPVALGNLIAGQGMPFTIQYQIPTGVQYFRASTYVTCNDLSGGAYAFPGPAPAL